MGNTDQELSAVGALPSRVVPEPTTLVLLGAGLAAIGVVRRRR